MPMRVQKKFHPNSSDPCTLLHEIYGLDYNVGQGWNSRVGWLWNNPEF